MEKDTRHPEGINRDKQPNIFPIIKKISLVLSLVLLADVGLGQDLILKNQEKEKFNIPEISLQKRNRLYEQKLLKIANIDNISPEQKMKAFEDIKYRENRLDSLNVSISMRVPLESVCIDENKNANIVTKFRNINYFPSVSLAYQLSETNFHYYLKYGKDAPTLTIICGLLSQETGIRDVVNPEGDSKGYGQLHYPTAKDLLERNFDIYGKYFFLKNGHVEFYGETKEEKEKNMLEVIYILLKEKEYDHLHQLLGLARYNGSQHDFSIYAIPVIRKAVSYAIFFAAVSNNTLTYDQEIKPIEYLIIEEAKKTGKIVTPKIIRDAFNYQVTEVSSWQKDPSNYRKNKNKKIENESFQLMYGKYSYITIDKEAIGDPYIIPEKGKTIFSYFRENTREATEYHNSKATNEKEKIELFYYEMINGKKTQHNITTKKEMEIKGNEGYMIYASPNKKKIYINPSYNLYYYEGTEGRITTIYYENTTNYQTNSSGGKIEYTSTRTDQK